MPIYDYECECGWRREVFRHMHDVEEPIICDECGKTMYRIFVAGHGAICYNNDAQWLKSITDIVDKDPNKPHCVEFIKNPTRENYEKWMKGEGIRPLESGERPKTREERQRESELKLKKYTDDLVKRHYERHSLVVQSEK